ncbi:hypothetical protein [Speluncibacter jeojiensis]|uniref:Lipoprotein n=1 Tax=Speluncibacter jeojiensis TaxID=2710754 RepID=A0A9X4M3Z3_9ACTN|nr:hypothetical protein [Corynebacteriales bacterium D3-21]
MARRSGSAIAVLLLLVGLAACSSAPDPHEVDADRVEHALAALPEVTTASVDYTDRPSIGPRVQAVVRVRSGADQRALVAISTTFAAQRGAAGLGSAPADLRIQVPFPGESAQSRQEFRQQDFGVPAAALSGQIGLWRDLVRAFGPAVSGVLTARTAVDPATLPFRQKFTVDVPSDGRSTTTLLDAYRRLAALPGADDPVHYWELVDAGTPLRSSLSSPYGLPSEQVTATWSELEDAFSNLPPGSDSGLSLVAYDGQWTVDSQITLPGVSMTLVPPGSFAPATYRTLVWPLLTAQTRVLARTGRPFAYRVARVGVPGPDGGYDYFVRLAPNECLRPIDDTGGGWGRDLRNYYEALPEHLPTSCP